MNPSAPPLSTEHRVHGLANDHIAPDWPPLTEAEVATLLAGYADVVRIDGVRWHSPRPLSAAALVATDAGLLFVKRHHQRVRTPETLAEEHRFTTHLRNAGAPVPAVLSNRDGRTALARDAWVYEVHIAAAGTDRYREAISWQPLQNRHDARAAGTALAELHRAAAGYQAPQRNTHVLITRCDLITAADPVAALAAQLPQRPGLADYLVARPWREDLTTVLGTRHAAVHERLKQQPRLWTHNDWHVSNLFWDGDVVSAVVDFGLASPTCAAFDLATAIERNAIAWLRRDQGEDDIGHVDTARALLDGYHQHTPLDAAARALIADLLPLIHVDFALSEVEYFHAITGHDDHAAVAYDTFLRGHAAWFEGAHGHAFLQALREPT